ncbi:MAG: mechanosensitive ion channel domain-containing protein, partial [Chloroflexota bacterium]
LFALLPYSGEQPAAVQAQGTPTPAPEEGAPDAPDRVEVQPEARDEEIRERLLSIMDATGWFIDPDVRVQDGVVFLMGQTESEDYRTWAGDLARRTQDVAAVVNQIEVLEPSVWDFGPALNGLREQARGIIRAIPLMGLSLLILIAGWYLAGLAVSSADKSLRRRQINQLLTNVIARGAGVLVFMLSLYVVFYVAGLSGIALTLLGGTGLLGIAIGIAFRDIAENFLASVFLSVQNPFHTGDLVDIDGTTGFVQTLTSRATVLMTVDGNHVQIPNATVYKSTIFNFTSNPNRREDFIVGIGYDDSVEEAQELALRTMAQHPAVLADPEPLVLAENLSPATVDLHLYFWLDGAEHSHVKVKSSVMRQVKRAFDEAGISMPGEGRELVFQDELPIRIIQPQEAPAPAPPRKARPARPAGDAEKTSTNAEGGLRSEAEEIQRQAQRSRPPEEGRNLLEDD